MNRNIDIILAKNYIFTVTINEYNIYHNKSTFIIVIMQFVFQLKNSWYRHITLYLKCTKVFSVNYSFDKLKHVELLSQISFFYLRI